MTLGGRLSAETVAEAWTRVVEPLRAANSGTLDVDASGLSYCEGAGVGLLIELQRLAAANGGRAEIRGLSTELEPLVRMASLDDPTAMQLGGPPRSSFAVEVGRAAADALADIRQIITFTGELAVALPGPCRAPAACAGATCGPWRRRWA